MAESSISPHGHTSDQSPDITETYRRESSSSFSESASSAATDTLFEGEGAVSEEPLTHPADTRGLANSYADALTELIRTEAPRETDLAIITEIGNRCVSLMEDSLEGYRVSTVVRVENNSIVKSGVTDRAHVSMRATAVREDETRLFRRDEEEVGTYDAARFPDVGGLWLGWPASFT